MFGRKHRPEPIEYDRERLKPVLRCSICTGEQTAGFQERDSGKFHEVQLIRTPQELQEFLDRVGLQDIEKIY